MSASTNRKTIVGSVDPEALAYTAGGDVRSDLRLVEADCIGSAAHARMLARMPLDPPLITPADADRLVGGLVEILRRHRAGEFRITLADQDVHLAVERNLTRICGDLGKKIHTGRSRNDQVALDLRLYARGELLGAMAEAAALATVLLRWARRHRRVPMVGRTHMQPAMPSSVGLWASSFAESLLDDAVLLMNAYELNDQCPLGSAAGYGVPLPIDRAWVSDQLGFSRPVHNVITAAAGRGKTESIILGACSQVMLTLSRFAQDVILFSMPEFGYFSLPPAFCTGSSIMPQKANPDVLELVRARAARVKGLETSVFEILRGAPSGYNRDLQETKDPFLDGVETTRATLRVLTPLAGGLLVHRDRLEAAFGAEVFATDRALELVREGHPFRDAYRHVKEHLGELEGIDPSRAVAEKQHLGAPAGLDFDAYTARVRALRTFVSSEQRAHARAYGKLLGMAYPAGLDHPGT